LSISNDGSGFKILVRDPVAKQNPKKVLNFYAATLKNQKDKNLYRSLTKSDAVSSTTIRRRTKKLTSFCCNDYLALSQNLQVKNAAIAAIKKFGLGARASRYVSGNNSLYEKLEKQIAKMKNCSDSIVFSSGYSAAIGVVPALVTSGDLILMDRLMHSCAIDGSLLSGARLMRFRHNDISHAKKILQQNRHKFKKCLIVTETVFSMDGDLGEVLELLKLAQEFDAILLSDAAHDLGLITLPLREGRTATQFGAGSKDLSLVATPPRLSFASSTLPQGEGKCLDRHLQMGTLSKAVGALGGYVAGDKILIDYLRNFAKSAIYSTALPPAILAASLASLKIISKKNLGQKALENAQYFCTEMNLPKPQSAIVPIILGENKKTLAAAKKLEERGFLVSAIRPPTVEAGKARLRITFSSAHKKSEIKKLAQILKENGFGFNKKLQS
jgi:8-amino-7-oxononanoate synthase